jgi:hypothetical protein
MNFANHWLKWKLTYWDLDPGDSRNPLMCRWNSQITSDFDQQYLNPSHPHSPSPPPTLRGSSHFSYLVPYHCPVCRFAHGHTGVFHNNFLWYKLWALICTINPFLPLLPALIFCTSHATLLCQKMYSSLAGQYFEKSFSRSFTITLSFW